MPHQPQTHDPSDADFHKGAVEAPSEGPETSPIAPGLDGGGLPNDDVAIAQDVIGANVDKTQG